MSAPPSRTVPVWAVPVAVLAVLLLLVGLVLNLGGSDDQQPTSQPAPTAATGSDSASSAQDSAPTAVQNPVQPDLTELERRDPSDVLAVGPVDAPVAIVVFSDYQCRYCAGWSEETLPVMMERAEAGDLRIEWRDVNIFGEASERASRAAYAAGLQGEFWEYHDRLYPEGNTRSEGDLSEEALVGLAGEMGLDTEQFLTDMYSPETDAEIDRNAKLGLNIGVHSTPAFLLNGQPIVGAQPTQVFVDRLDAALAG